MPLGDLEQLVLLAILHLGDEGYLRLTAAARRVALAFADAIEARPALRLLARPDTTLVTFAAAEPGLLDVFAVADQLWERGWYVDRQSPPPSLHCTVSAVHVEDSDPEPGGVAILDGVRLVGYNENRGAGGEGLWIRPGQ